MKRITVLGIGCVDIFVSGYKKIPLLGQLEFANEFKLHTGGCALNCSIDLVKIGIEHKLIIPVGKDIFGDFIRKSLVENKVDESGVIFLDNIGTSTSIVLLDSSGERSFLHNPGANAALDIQDLDLDSLFDTDILFIGGALLMPNFDGDQMAEVFRMAQEKGVFTVLDIGWDSTGKWMKTLEKVLNYVDLFVPSIDEAEKLTGTSDLSEINSILLNKGAKETIIKLGDKGAVYFADGEPVIISSVSLEKIVDTTGAGDSFMSGILTGLQHSWNTKDMIEFANIVGSMCVQGYGASQGIQSFDHILKRKMEYYG